MSITLPPLPFAADALEPHISARTLEFHHGKHHKAYVDKTNALLEGKLLADEDLPKIVRAAKTDGNAALFNNSAQAWNHDFFWRCLSPGGGGQPAGPLGERLQSDFGGIDDFKSAFTEAAVGNFGSGWTWLCDDGGRLTIVNTDDADTPLVKDGLTPLLVLDVWEHAYYLDYQNERPKFVDAFLASLANWHFAATNLR